MDLYLKKHGFCHLSYSDSSRSFYIPLMHYNSMHSMYTTSNINITNARNPNMINENDIFTLGVIHSLKSIIKAIKDTDGTANEIDFQEVLEIHRRNLSDPELEEHIVDVSEQEELR